MFIEEFLFQLYSFLESPITENDYDIIFMLEQLSYDYFDQYSKENKEIAKIISEDFASFCRSIEYEGDYKEYRKKLQVIYNQIRVLL